MRLSMEGDICKKYSATNENMKTVDSLKARSFLFFLSSLVSKNKLENVITIANKGIEIHRMKINLIMECIMPSDCSHKMFRIACADAVASTITPITNANNNKITFFNVMSFCLFFDYKLFNIVRFINSNYFFFFFFSVDEYVHHLRYGLF